MINDFTHKERFEGFQKTTLLWENCDVFGLNQLEIQGTTHPYVPDTSSKKLRLGKWVEVYTNFQLQQQAGIKIIAKNIQLKRHKDTIGELDVLFLKDKQAIHLEMAYKFYLYDTLNTYETALQHWIGPNRNDNLIFKLNKLKHKQLPLLFSNEASDVLKGLHLNPQDFKQFVNFKAQLFVPFEEKVNLEGLNRHCISGFYISINHLNRLKDCNFYIVSKLNWLCQPQLNVNWLDFEKASLQIKTFINQKRSPLCWILGSDKQLTKCFVTWW